LTEVRSCNFRSNQLTGSSCSPLILKKSGQHFIKPYVNYSMGALRRKQIHPVLQQKMVLALSSAGDAALAVTGQTEGRRNALPEEHTLHTFISLSRKQTGTLKMLLATSRAPCA
jgi:hypothetical protein